MARSTKQQAQAKAKAPKQEQATQAQAKAPKGAMTASAAVRLWQGETITRSLLVAEAEGMTVLVTELQLSKKDRRVKVATKRRAEVKDGRIHPLDKPVTIGTGEFGYDEALTQDEAKTRVEKWLKRAKALDALARQGDEEAAEKAKSLREQAKTLCRAYGLQINKDGSVSVKEQPANATEPANAETA